MARPVPTLAALLLATLAAGCAARAPSRVTRILEGQPRTGPYVSPSAYEAFVRAELAFASGRIADAAAGYRAALRDAPEDPLVLARLAETLARSGDEAGARRVLAQAFDADPDAEAAWLARGRIAELRGAREEAIDAYARAAWLAPHSSEPLLALAATLSATGEEGRAEALLLERARGADGGGLAASRAALAVALQRADAWSAAQAARALLRHAPTRRDDVVSTADAALRAGHPEVAAALLDTIPARADDARLRARAYRLSGRAEEDAPAEDGHAPRGPAALAVALREAGLGTIACELLDGRSDRPPAEVVPDLGCAGDRPQ